MRASRGDQDPAVTELLVRIGDARRDLGRTPDARAAYAEAVALCESSEKGEHWLEREARLKLSELGEDDRRGDADRERLRRARELEREARWMFQLGRHLAALPVCEQALAIQRELRRGTHHEVAQCQLLLGQLQASRVETYLLAFDTLSAARDAIRRALGPDHPAHGTCLHWLGVLEDDRGAFVEAKGLYTAALEVFDKARGQHSADYTRTLNRLGHMYAQWWVTGAEAHILRAMQTRESVLGPDHPDFAESLHDLGELAFNNLQFEKAKGLFRRAVEIRERALGAGHPDVAETLSWLGRTQTQEVDLTLGHVEHLRAIAAAEAAHGLDHPRTCRCREAFARSLTEECDYQRADRIFRQVEAARERLGLTRHPLHADLLLAASKNLDEWICRRTQNELCAIDVRPAEEMYDRTIRLYESLQTGKLLPGYAGALATSVSIYYYDEYRVKPRSHVRDRLDQALRAMEARGPAVAHPYYDEYLHSSIQFVLAAGDHKRAGELARELIEYGRSRFGYSFPHRTVEGPLQAVTVDYHRGLSPATVTPELLDRVDELCRYFAFLSSRYGQVQSQRARLGAYILQYETVSALLTAAMVQGRGGEIYRQILSFRGRVAAAQNEDRLAHDHPDLKPLLDELRATRQQLARLVYQPPAADADRPRWVEEIHALSDRKDDLESRIASLVRARPRAIAADPSPGDVQKALPADATLVEYFCYIRFGRPRSGLGRLAREARVAAFVVRPDGEPVCIDLGPRERVEEAVAGWRRAVNDYQGGNTSAPVYAKAKEVAELVWKPVAGRVGRVKTVLVAPDGPLCFLPFAALPGSQPGSYLIEDYAIGYVPAGRTVVDLYGPKPAPTGDGLLAVGGVSYSAGTQEYRGSAHAVRRAWPDLPFTGYEADQVLARFREGNGGGRVASLRGADATPAGFARLAAGHWRFIHYAGHGFFADPTALAELAGGPPGDPPPGRGINGGRALLRNQLILSGLVLSRDSASADSILTAEQVGELDLRGTEMVVLSACETGLGNIAGGEGVMGLQRAILTAGARSTVASLWKVHDAATAVLMEQFYTNLWVHKMTKLDALRQAQITVLRNPDLVTARSAFLRGIDTGAAQPLPTPQTSGNKTHPTLWAAFVLTGDGR